MTERSRLDALRSRIRIARFVSVGVLGAICDTTVLLVLTEGLGVLPELATLVGIETAILVMFTVNDRWTFRDEGRDDHRSLLRRLGRSHLVRIGGSLTQFVVFVIVYRLLFVSLVAGDLPVVAGIVNQSGLDGIVRLDLWLLVAKGTGIGIGMIVNYVFESLFTWQVVRSGSGTVEHNS